MQIIEFLGIDFGTTNSLAGIVNDKKELELVPLEGDKHEMPSALFLKINDTQTISFNEDEFERRVRAAIKDEERRTKVNLDLITKKLNDFYKVNVPKLVEPKSYDYNYPSQYKKAYKKYLQDLEDYPKVIKLFKDTKLKDEEKRLRKEISRAKSIEMIKEEIRVQMDQQILTDESELMNSKTFFSALDSLDSIPLFGQRAIEQYKKNPAGGFFMRSPKAFLGINLIDVHKDLFARTIALVIGEIKLRSESYLGKKFKGVVLGYPVNYMGVDSVDGNKQALSIMRKAAQLAGFNEIRFVIEPMAASLVISKTIFDSNTPALVVDIGGGTTDVVLFEVNSAANEKLKVINAVGERVGGNDFDEILAKRSFGPYIGFSGELKNGKIVPNQILLDGLSTRDIYKQANFRRCGKELYDLLSEVKDPRPFNRLYQIYKMQLQHQILLISEDTKMMLSKNQLYQVKFDFLNDPFNLEMRKNDLLNIFEKELKLVQRNILRVFDGYESYKDNYRIFLTGGMSQSSIMIEYIKEFLPKGIVINRISALQSVAAGLAVVARNLTLSDDSYTENYSVRGIPVIR